MDRTKKIQYFVLAFTIILSLAIHIVPKNTLGLHKFVFNETQKVLSVIKAYRIDSELLVDIYKIKRGNNLLIEIYEHNSGKLFQQLAIDKSFDSYFNFNGISTNLFINDINGDLKPEVIVPAYNENLIASLHIYSFQDGDRLFRAYNPYIK